MNTLRETLVLAAFLCTGFTTDCMAKEETPSWKAELASDLVEIKGDIMVIEGYDLCKVGDTNLQLKSYSEAPNDGSISRDHFVTMTTTYTLVNLMGLGELECKDIKAPIGSVDLELSIYMTDVGIKQVFRDKRTNTENSTTVLWSEILGD